MEKTKKQIGPAIFYLKKHEGILFTDKLASPISLTFPKDVIDNLEVINKEKLQILIKTFIQRHIILPTSIIFVLDKELIFEKDIEADSSFEQTEEIGKFLDIVPFEKLLSRIFKTKEKTKIVAANREFCEELINSFENEKFSVSAVSPFSMFENIIPLLKKNFDGKLALDKISLLKQYSLLEVLENTEKRITYTKPKIKSPRFVLLIGTFAALLLILLVLIFSQLLTSSKVPSKTQELPAAVQQGTQSGGLEITPSK